MNLSYRKSYQMMNQLSRQSSLEQNIRRNNRFLYLDLLRLMKALDLAQISFPVRAKEDKQIQN